MKKGIILSICIPTYNRKDILKDTLDEIFSYPNNDIEVVVIDNASTDGTGEMLDNYDDIRLTVKHNMVNAGMFENQIDALFSGNGKYTLALMDRDKIFVGKLLKLVSYLRCTDIGIIQLGNRETRCTYKKGVHAVSYIIIRTHPSFLLYNTSILKTTVNKEEILSTIKSDSDCPYAYTGIVGMLLLNRDDEICIYPNDGLVLLEVKQTKSYTRYRMKLKNIYYAPEGSRRRYLNYVDEMVKVYSKKETIRYLPYVFAGEFYRGTVMHFLNSHDRYTAHKYNIKKIKFETYFKYGLDLYKTAMEQQIKLKIFKFSNAYEMLSIMGLYLYEMYLLLRNPSKRREAGEIEQSLEKWNCGMYNQL